MSLYLKPPRGNIHLHTLLECTSQRLKYYNLQNDLNDVNLQQNKPEEDVVNFEYLFEDSILDRTGHFIFRLAALSNPYFKSIFVKHESLLFESRINFYEKNDLKSFLKNVIRQIKDCLQEKVNEVLATFFLVLTNVCIKISSEKFLIHVYQMPHLENEREMCRDCSFEVEFQYCNNLVARREVELKKGYVQATCKNWKRILLSLYASYLKIVLNDMKFSQSALNALNDSRLKICLKKIRKCYFDHETTIVETKGTVKNINEETQYFPLCMKNLYDSLKINHRLSHNDRFNFSLFLKGIGLAVKDSITFWQREYSKVPSKCVKCSHYWQQNEKRYLYGIRHLYGLEGSRKNYSVSSCSNFQKESVGFNNEGGCPFVHYDDDFLRKALKKQLPGFEDDIEVMIYERKRYPTASCRMYYETRLKKFNKEASTSANTFHDPLQYYISFKKSLS